MTDATPPRRPYETEDVKRLLSYFFHGGQRWQRPDAPDQDMPKAAGNPSHQGTEKAEQIDMTRAWFACVEADEFLDTALLWGRFAKDLPIPAMAKVLGLSRQLAEYRIYRDIEHLTTAINEGRRPAGELPHYRYANFLKGELL